jgi:glycoprotein-N-acetylgalactosamine 3-beta-galactosyltransferase
VEEKKVRLLCLILTSPNKTEKAAVHVKATWGKRCDILYFVSTMENATLPTIALKGRNESRNILWAKTKLGFQHAYENYFDKADWFLKVEQ